MAIFIMAQNHHTENKDLACSHSSACHLLGLRVNLKRTFLDCSSLNPSPWFTQSSVFRCLINAAPHTVLDNASRHIQGSYPTISWIKQKWIDVTIKSLLIQRNNSIVNLKDFILSHCSNSRESRSSYVDKASDVENVELKHIYQKLVH